MTSNTDQISCIILAGGRGKRAGGLDKGLIPYKDIPLIEHVINAVKNQVDDFVISANRNTETYKRYSANIIGDTTQDYQGPLAGIAACIKYCKHKLILIVACDMPNLPADLTTRLTSEMKNKSISIATVDGHHQLAMIVAINGSDADVYDSVQQKLNTKQLKLIQWVESLPYTTVSFDDNPDAFLNLNHLTIDN
ncbi:MAG: molybdenum cofactor guanylyltransferase [Proteobacteria bacterium]|nr:molybdenum cofactor guanylyltransferase [Pseudomonadota bacterium]